MWTRFGVKKLSRGDSRDYKLGVNVVGYFSSELGMGELGRIVIKAVEQSGLPFSTLTSNRNQSRKSHKHEDLNPTQRLPINIFVINADQMANWQEFPEFREISKFPTVGVWAWELEDFPDQFAEVFDGLEEVWTISEFARKAIQQQTKKPVHVLPMPITRINSAEISDRNPLLESTRGTPYFLAIFDFQSSMDRKNPLATIEAFKSAFKQDEGVKLVIKTINGNLWPKQMELLSKSILGYPNIQIFDQYLERSEVLGLMKNALAYVSLHRSEGYGLTLAESMELGTPVIATAYSGNMDFMNEKNSLLVDYDLIEVRDSSGAYVVKSRWADPRIRSAAGHMRSIFEDLMFAKEIGLAGKNSAKNNFELSRTAQFIYKRVKSIKRSTKPFSRKKIVKTLRRAIARFLPRRFKDFIRQRILR